MFKARVVTALLLMAGFLAALFLLPFWGWLLLMSALAGMAAWEWGGLIRLGAAARRAYALFVAMLSVALGALAFDMDTGAVRQADLLYAVFLLAAGFWLLVVPFWLKAKWPLSARLPGLLSGVVILIPAALAMMLLRAFAPLFLLAVMALIWVADIGAYVCGRAFGRHKLAPFISPGKTWEGVAGAVAGVLIYATAVFLATGRTATAAAWAWFLAALCVLTAVSILGDLFESLAKRQAGVKDSGAVLPGHGGVLDRIDSLTSTLPLVGIAVLESLAWEALPS